MESLPGNRRCKHVEVCYGDHGARSLPRRLAAAADGSVQPAHKLSHVVTTWMSKPRIESVPTLVQRTIGRRHAERGALPSYTPWRSSPCNKERDFLASIGLETISKANNKRTTHTHLQKFANSVLLANIQPRGPGGHELGACCSPRAGAVCLQGLARCGK